MVHRWTLTAATALMVVSTTFGQSAAWRFRWQPGQTLTYKVDQVTAATEVLEGKKTQTTSRLHEIKRWQVLGVDAAGVATLQLSLAALRMETTTATGEVLLFDSAAPDQSNAQLRDQLTKFVGTSLAMLRVDCLGRVVEVKECKNGSPARYESDPPFAITLPEGDGSAGWERNYRITLEPPRGTGEKFEAVQKYLPQKVDGRTASIVLTTILKTQPEALADRVPLLELQPEGQVVFDIESGLLQSANLRVSKEVKNHQGQGSSYQVEGNYTEQFLGKK